MTIIQVEGLRKNYGSVQALNGISFSVEKGEIIGLLGPNGAGKTTTMKILTGYIQPNEGNAKIAGHDVVDNPVAVQSVLGYLPENAPLYLDMAVQEYLLMIAELRGVAANKRLTMVSEAVYSTALENHLTKPIGSLSKGYRQRVGLAQAILHKPEVLILDEPTNGLDPTQIVEIRSLIKRLAQNSTVIVSTHILPEVEATCDRAIIIIAGQIKADAKLSELTSTSSALVGVLNGPSDIQKKLETIEGVQSVVQEGPSNGAVHFRVTGDKGLQLCPLIFDTAKDAGWRLSELRQQTRTLESVFRELSSQGGNA